jgi:uncharacterized protein YecT (DUF1311 family)
MRQYASAFISAVVFLAPAGAAELLCAHAKNTIDEARCLSGELDRVDKVLAEYLNAAKERLARENAAKPQLDAAQDAWLKYRSAHCGDVYTYWEAGSYRYRAELECEIKLTRSRTHDIWAAYLTYADSTPALRPEPGAP